MISVAPRNVAHTTASDVVDAYGQATQTEPNKVIAPNSRNKALGIVATLPTEIEPTRDFSMVSDPDESFLEPEVDLGSPPRQNRFERMKVQVRKDVNAGADSQVEADTSSSTYDWQDPELAADAAHEGRTYDEHVTLQKALRDKRSIVIESRSPGVPHVVITPPIKLYWDACAGHTAWCWDDHEPDHIWNFVNARAPPQPQDDPFEPAQTLAVRQARNKHSPQYAKSDEAKQYRRELRERKAARTQEESLFLPTVCQEGSQPRRRRRLNASLTPWRVFKPVGLLEWLWQSKDCRQRWNEVWWATFRHRYRFTAILAAEQGQAMRTIYGTEAYAAKLEKLYTLEDVLTGARRLARIQRDAKATFDEGPSDPNGAPYPFLNTPTRFRREPCTTFLESPDPGKVPHIVISGPEDPVNGWALWNNAPVDLNWVDHRMLVPPPTMLQLVSMQQPEAQRAQIQECVLEEEMNEEEEEERRLLEAWYREADGWDDSASLTSSRSEGSMPSTPGNEDVQPFDLQGTALCRASDAARAGMSGPDDAFDGIMERMEALAIEQSGTEDAETASCPSSACSSIASITSASSDSSFSCLADTAGNKLVLFCPSPISYADDDDEDEDGPPPFDDWYLETMQRYGVPIAS